MIRTMTGFHQDEVGDWVAELDCLHNQHVRHQPPFRLAPWVTDAAGRAEHIGADLDCPLCDRAELPDGLTLTRTAGPFDETSLPDGLRGAHRVAGGRWGRLRVLEGEVTLVFESPPPAPATLSPGETHPIPPEVPHHVEPQPGFRLEIDFLVPPVETVPPSSVPPEEQGGDPACWVDLVDDHRDKPSP